MPRLAIALFVLGFVSLFVVRTVVQWHETGSTGWKGFHGRVGSLPWAAGVSVNLGLLLVVAAPVAAWLDWPGGALLAESMPVHLAGALCVVAGNVGALLAQRSLGDSWRVGVDDTETTELVTTGLFARVRNPFFGFLGVSILGLLLLVPNVLSLCGTAVTAIGVQIQVRVVEEPYLAAKHGPAYREYASRVGRFLPGIGRLDPSATLPRAD